MNSSQTTTVEESELPVEEYVKENSVQTGEEDQPRISKDMIFEILKNWRRRQVLRYLDENGGSARLQDLAEMIAAKENNIDIQAISSSQRKRVYIALYQCHLPKMDDYGVIEYNQARGTLQLREPANQLFPFLYYDHTQEDNETGIIGGLRSKLYRTFQSEPDE